MVLGIGSRAIRAYIDTYKRMPSDEILASVHQAVENTLKTFRSRQGDGREFFESIGKDMSTTDGIIMRNRSHVVHLLAARNPFAITSQMVTRHSGAIQQIRNFSAFTALPAALLET